MRFLLEDTVRIEPPTDAELRAWLEAHPDRFALPAKISFSQRFFSRGKRGAALSSDAQAALGILLEDPDAVTDDDPFFRGSRFDQATPSEIKRAFGEKFADAMADLPLGQWQGPLESSYGLHLVRITERTAASTPALETVRDQVEQDWLQSERARRNDETLAKLRARYAPKGPE